MKSINLLHKRNTLRRPRLVFPDVIKSFPEYGCRLLLAALFKPPKISNTAKDCQVRAPIVVATLLSSQDLYEICELVR